MLCSDDPHVLSINTKYNAYMSLYNSLDRTIWNMPPILIGGVTLIVSFNLELGGRDNGEVGPFIMSGLLAVSALVICMGAYSLVLLRRNQRMVGDWLRKMEEDGYFHDRERTRDEWPPRAPIVYMYVFGTLGIGAIISSLYFLAIGILAH